jgi:sugar O-acyltransferase (sialic acid O-acetyltransferase NeuD family)
MKRIALLGAGGHAKVVWDTVQCLSEREHLQVVAALDDDPKLWGQALFGLTIDGPVRRIAELPVDAVIVAIGDNQARQRVFEQTQALGIPLLSAIHPTAVIAHDVQLGRGVVAFAQVAVNSGTVIGDDVILNTACSVDHDCVLGAHVHVAPGAHLCGGVHVGPGTLVGVGAVVIPNLHIGADVTVGAGAVVLHDLPDGVTAVGVSARILAPAPRKQ